MSWLRKLAIWVTNGLLKSTLLLLAVVYAAIGAVALVVLAFVWKQAELAPKTETTNNPQPAEPTKKD